MFTKISIVDIVTDHISTLRDGRTGKIYIPDIILFFILPAIVSGVMAYLGISLSDNLVNALITSFSIFSALLFNLLLLVYDISGKKSEQIKGSDQSKITDPLEIKRIGQKNKLLREIYVNVSFSILVSIICVVILLTYFLKPTTCEFWVINLCLLKPLFTFVVYFLAVQFILTLFMVLKRIYKLLAKAFENSI